ncbi:hypothetical protein [Bacillus atrophaeus]|uniref:hypothetical protein n=1 Tax=Bacillus atrophaeus TaxID=1452 RepID=UPI002281A5E6|nr:hypothetical protein [Bacillus atrophaeus]MCY8513783.1 hypothetical protein [Bacillus atrophaeus]MCY8993413.1 hypothetical protein [Bacillus atrophaeus]
MDKLQEIISDLSLWHLASEEELKPLDINAGPCYIIEQSYVKDIMIGFMKKQQTIIEEHHRQQEITVNQFRQAQEEIQRLKQENTRYEYLLGESELSDKIQSICDHCKLTSGGREITIKDEEFGFLIEEANKSHRLQAENNRFKEALQVYSDENKYRRTPRMSQWATAENEKLFGDFNPSFMEVDRGQTAIKALERVAE